MTKMHGLVINTIQMLITLNNLVATLIWTFMPELYFPLEPIGSSSDIRACLVYTEAFDGPKQFTQLGAKCSAIWLIGQILQRCRWAVFVHRRPVFKARWASL